MTCLLEQLGVADDTVGLDNICHAVDLAAVLDSEGVTGEFLGDSRVGQIIAVILPVGIADRTVDLEQGGSVGLGDFGSECRLIGALRGGQNVNLYTGFLGVCRCQILPCLILFGLEVQVVDMTLRVAAAAGAGSQAAKRGRNQHCRSKNER